MRWMETHREGEGGTGETEEWREVEKGEKREWSDTRRKRRTRGGGHLRDRPLIIHGALSTPIEGENHSCESESSHRAHPPSSPFFLPLSSPLCLFQTWRLLFTVRSVASGAIIK